MASVWKLRWAGDLASSDGNALSSAARGAGPASAPASVSDVALLLLWWEAICGLALQVEVEEGPLEEAVAFELAVRLAGRQMPKSWAELAARAARQPGRGLFAELAPGVPGGPFEFAVRYPGSDLALLETVRLMGGATQAGVISFELAKVRRWVEAQPLTKGDS